jgi:hypothetical protein
MRGRMLVKPAGAELSDVLGPVSKEAKTESVGGKAASAYE